jgi:F-type H+-transporting ATPase subunit d
MSGSGVVKKVADAAEKAGKAIDWDGLAKMLVSEEARKEYATLRRTFEDVNHQLHTKFSQVPVPIYHHHPGSGSSALDQVWSNRPSSSHLVIHSITQCQFYS